MTDKNKLRQILKSYERDFYEVRKDEKYKWQAVKHYQNTWDIETEGLSFISMLANAFDAADNLLKGSYSSYKFIVDYAAKEPETVNSLFQHLHNETMSLEERYYAFKNQCAAYAKALGINSFQDLHAISVYLFFQYPEKYYIYRYTSYKEFGKEIDFFETSPDKLSDLEKYKNYQQMCELVIEELKDFPNIVSMHQLTMDESCYEDKALHLLAQDIIYYIERYKMQEEEYWPTLEEYNPNLTKEDWKQFILEIELPDHPSPMRMLKGMLLLGGEASCKQLAETYGGTPQVYIGCTINLGKRAIKYFNLKGCIDGDKERVFVVPFQGKYSGGGENTYIYRIRPELKDALEEINLSDLNPNYKGEEEIEMSTNRFEKNTILYGPPGTGKTYHTIIYAVAIIENKTIEEIKDQYKDNYPALVQKYNEYKEKGRVAFTTFHQSYGYEEFIEGIRPVMNEDDSESQNIHYEIKPGVFKAFCEKAAVPVFSDQQADLGLNDAPKIWKVSLEGTGDNDTRTECLTNNHIRIGYDEYGPNIDGLENYPSGGKNVLNAFSTRMRIGDIVLSCYSATTIDAVGVVTGDCEWDDSYDAYKRVRKVKWLAKGFNEDIWDINGETVMNQVTVYQLKNIVLDDVMEIVEKYAPDTFKSKATYPNHVFIIDEISRGNISKIFGELITLIEPAKRKGEPEGMEVTLPYSPKSFSVPSNVYIIGTMNTADRSIALMDTALRRRFAFEEMQPDLDVLDGIMVDKYSVKDMLKIINDRIEVLYDREHTIGHAYFMPLVEDNSIEKLAEIFENKIIPLLQEYFYEDYEKIQLVLGDNQKEDDNYKFIKKTPVNIQSLFGNTDLDLDETDVYTINKDAFVKIESYEFLV